MKGAIICLMLPESENDQRIEPNFLGFAQFFAPILDTVAEFHWITLHYQSSPFVNVMATPEGWDRAEELRIGVKGLDPDLGVQLWRPPALQEFANHVRNDWQNFIGIRKDRDPLEVTRRFASLAARPAFGASEWTTDFIAAIEEEAHLVFFADDTNLWEVYAADGHLVSVVLNHCRELGEGIRVRSVDLADRERVLSERW